ncbi:MAG: spore cortex biosynthesis protein YabQ [Clostridia bacterium]|nr:spore cortex biosynthesis protein YabQ [Clostridia bacterium]
MEDQTQLLVLLLMCAGGALCAALYDIFAFFRRWTKKAFFLQLWDCLYVLLCSAFLLMLWCDIGRVQLRLYLVFSVICGALLYHFGIGFYVRLCLEKCINTICGMLKKRAEKTSKKLEK